MKTIIVLIVVASISAIAAPSKKEELYPAINLQKEGFRQGFRIGVSLARHGATDAEIEACMKAVESDWAKISERYENGGRK